MCEQVVHSADLGAQSLPWELAQAWGSRVLSEFAAQAQKERDLGLPVTKFMEVRGGRVQPQRCTDTHLHSPPVPPQNLDDPLKAAQVQCGFLGNVVLPLWQVVAQVLPKAEVRARAGTARVAPLPCVADTHRTRRAGSGSCRRTWRSTASWRPACSASAKSSR